MKNVIGYYYELYPEQISKNTDYTYFYIEDKKYILLSYDRNVNESKDLYELNEYLYKNNYLFHKIILNKFKEVVTYVENNPHLLMRLEVNENGIANLYDLINISNINLQSTYNTLKRDNWINLWTEKLDYYEYQMSEINVKFPLLKESFDYYLGLAENALIYAKNASIEEKPNNQDKPVISHRKLNINFDLFDVYNPINIVVDHKTRNISEYIKVTFYKKCFNFNEIIEYIKVSNLSNYGYRLLIARLLYPSNYFDMYEKILEEKIKEEEIINVIELSREYEVIIYNIYMYLRNYTYIPEIPWLNKINIYN